MSEKSVTTQEEKVQTNVNGNNTNTAQQQKLFSHLSTHYKNPLRTIMSEQTEFILNSISNMTNEMVMLHTALQAANQRIIYLEKLCSENKIDYTKNDSNNNNTLPPQNRKQRRAQQKKMSKNEK